MAGGSWLVLVLLVWCLPVAFCAYLKEDTDTAFWYFISQSGGLYGTTMLGILLCAVVATLQKGVRQKAKSFSIAFLFLLFTLGGVAVLNEFVVKPLAQVPRPSHTYLLSRTGDDPTLLKKFYGQEVAARQAFLIQYLKQHPEKTAKISPVVLAHWVDEAGYSFPSGHSQNAFLLGSMLAMGLGYQMPRKKRFWLAVPLAWAVLVCMSRVALGVHSELDVSLGAGVGFLFAYLFSLTGILKRVFKEATTPSN